MVCNTPSYGHAPTYQISLTYLERNNYLILRSKVKVQKRSLWYTTHRLMVMHPYQISLTYLKRNNYLTLRSRSNKGYYGIRHTALWTCTHIPNIIDLTRKKQLFDLEVKGQGPTKDITVRDTPPYGHTPTYQISLTYLKTNMLWPRQENTI